MESKKEIEKTKAYLLSKNFKDTEYMVNFIAEQMAEYHLSQPKEEPKKEVDLEEFREEWIKRSDYIKTKNISIQGIWDFFLPHLQKPVESEWISVEDRLPKGVTKVLFLNTNEFDRKKEIRLGQKHDSDGWYSYDAYEDEVFTVTHWMPLPQPPNSNN